MTKIELVKKVIDVFREEGLQIEENQKLLSDNWRKSTVDYVVYQEIDGEQMPFAVVITTSSAESVNLTYAKRIIAHILEDSAFWFGLVIDKDIHIYSFVNNESRAFSWKKVDERILSDKIAEFADKCLVEDSFKKILIDSLDNVSKESARETIIATALKELVTGFKYVRYGRTVSVSFEEQFALIKTILKAAKIKPIKEFCRYTSSASLHRIIDGQKESMCGLAVMNDKSEGFYFDKYLSPKSSSSLWRKTQKEVDAYNKVFITSLCGREKSDDLTMWRLYGGQDGDGVCLEYDIDLDYLRKSQNFLLMPVFYGNSNNPVIQVFRFILKLPLIAGFQFVLSCKNIFRYYVKPDGFKIEDEQRLLFIRDNAIASKIDKPKWIFNSSYKIFHPIQELKLHLSGEEVHSPLILKKIILGPKCAEPNINRVQLLSWLETIGLKGITVVESSIKFYR